MKTDNSNISNSLEDAAKKAFKSISNKFVNNLHEKGFIDGANWKEDQYKDLILSYAELLEALRHLLSMDLKDCLNELEQGFLDDGLRQTIQLKDSIIKAESAIENAKKIKP